jgi:ATPase subunit of ABC transporter with duplicated ATPase domains
VAANGRGKSTLLRCLAGTLEASEGDVTRSRGLTVGHVEQDVPPALLPLPFHEAVLQALPEISSSTKAGGSTWCWRRWRCRRTMRERPVGQLSGGWQRLAMLARVWVTEPDVLMLDEPTNHLDLGKIARLEDWLTPCRATCLSSSPATTAPFWMRRPTGRCSCGRSNPVFSLPYSAARAPSTRRMPPTSGATSAT